MIMEIMTAKDDELLLCIFLYLSIVSGGENWDIILPGNISCFQSCKQYDCNF